MSDYEEFRDESVEWATRALHAGLIDDWPTAAKAVVAMHRKLGNEAVLTAILAWIDTALHSAGNDDYGGPVRLLWQQFETGQIGDNVDALRPEQRWAGRLFAARLADDEETFMALVASLPTDDPVAVGDHIMAVLMSAVLTIRRGQTAPAPGRPG